MKRSIYFLFIVAFLGGCGYFAEGPPELPLRYDAEHLPEQNGMKFTKHDVFPWHRVRFVLNKFYVCEEPLVKDRETVISYDRFISYRTGESYNYRDEEPYRIRIDCAEGKGPPKS